MILEERIKKNEGLSLTRYIDTLGNPTIGYGHLLPASSDIQSITLEEAEHLFNEDIAEAKRAAVDIFEAFATFAQNRQDAIIELLFNLGKTKFLRFIRMIHNINIGHWDDAAAELKYADGKKTLSRWYTQVKERRAEEIIELLREG